MHTNLDIKMVKDGNRTYIVINGASEEQDMLAYRLLNLYAGFSVDGDLPRVNGLEPVPVAPMPSVDDLDNAPAFTPWSTDEVMSGGPYKGMTPHQALARYDSEALAKLYDYAKELSPSRELDSIKKSCKQFMVNLPNHLSYYNTDEKKKKLLMDASSLMKIEVIINGYPSITDFCERATATEIDTAVNHVARSLQQRGDRS